MTATVSALLEPGSPRATAESVLDQLDQLADSVPGLRPVAEQLAGALYPVEIRPPRQGENVLGCADCRRAVALTDLRWWPRITGMAASLRLGCEDCAAAAADRLARNYR